MLDSGSAVSLVREDVVRDLKDTVQLQPAPQLQLVTPSGEALPILDHMKVPVQISKNGGDNI